MRSEFTSKTKREALARAGDGDPEKARCEAVGEVYGLAPGHRCNVLLKGRKKEFDHYPERAADGGSNELSNCVVVCVEHHSFKTRTFDTPMAAKGKRVSDKHLGIRKPSRLSGPRFPKAVPQHTASRPLRRKGE